MLAAWSLGKRPTKRPNLKLLRLFAAFAWARERISIKMYSTESRFVYDHQIYCLQACMWAFFSPESLHAGVNPLTAMLAALSVEKWPIEVPNLKFFWLFHPFAWTFERNSIQMHSTESGFVMGPSNTLFAGVYVCTFQPGILYRLWQRRG